MPLSRREFLLRAAAVSAGAAVATLPACAPDMEPAALVDAPAAVNGKITLPLSVAPQLGKDGGAVIVRSPGAPRILVARALGTYGATSAICTHQGCPLGFDGTDIVCPCHFSRFGLDGSVRHPPATAPLPIYSAALDPQAQAIVIDLRPSDRHLSRR
jgi:Rieske Fe-S protein